MASYNLNLNFVSLINTNFRIVCYRKRIIEEPEERPFLDVAQYRLPSGSQEEAWPLYWISLDVKEGWERFEFTAQDNHAAALWVLNRVLLPHLQRHIASASSNYLTEIADGHFTALNVKLKRHSEGWQGVRLELKYLKEKRLLGAIVNYHFFADTDKQDLNRRRILELSFSFDSSGHSNKNFYVDRYRWETAFVQKFLRSYKYVPTETIPDEITFNSAFSMLPAFTLSEREYDFAGGGRNNVQYWGLTKYGPCEAPRTAPKFYFVFRKQDKAAAISLYKALAGKTYPGRFPGMEQVFKVCFSSDAISSCEIDDFSRSSMDKAARFVKDKGDANAVCIALIDDDAADQLPIILYKLHGSLDWRREKMSRMLYCEDSPDPCSDIDDYQLIFGTTYKLSYQDPFLYQISELRKFSGRARLIIAIGYGFNDDHINEIIGKSLSQRDDAKLLSVDFIKDASDSKAKERREYIKKKLQAESMDDSRVIVYTDGAKTFLDKQFNRSYVESLLEDEAAPF